MENQSNKGNTSSSSARMTPSSSPQRPPSPNNETQTVVDAVDPSMTENRDVGGFNLVGPGRKQLPLKNLEEVFAHPTISENTGGSPPPPPPPSPPQGGSMAIAVGGGGVVMGDIGPGAAVGDIGAVKKRKAFDLKDPPMGKTTCPKCNKAFSSWNAVFGHMKMHPNRGYHGVFKRRALASPSSKHTGGASQVAGEGGSSGGQGRSGKAGPSSPVRGLAEFDLNQPAEGAADPAEEGNVHEGNKLGFDLNESPPDEDEEKP